ncbi:hypothetical protein HanPI659440_Chr17g0661861 [Helianthus annuus]|nr:hypothetical protein HanPI659440_Chr17g0661861 [Helianthus annuus]
MTIDHRVECATATTRSSALGRDTLYEMMDPNGERPQDSVSSNNTRNNLHDDIKVLASHDFRYGKDGGFNKDWPMLSQDANSP